ncbi:MAG: PepSY domain-containing protein [Vicinamibacterales bacterium]
MKRLRNWRSVLVYVHRWLGIAGCLLFVAWFVSGVVLMYVRMPSLTAEERLLRAAPLDLSTARVEPVAAAELAGFAPTSLRATMLAGRPAYVLNAGPRWASVYADTGERIRALTREQAAAIARAFAPEHAGALTYDGYVVDSDQWTLSSALRPLMPLHRFALRDPLGTTVYISALTGEPVMKTTRRERLWNYAGAVTHWLYFTPLRRHTGLWVDVVVYLSLAGCVMCASGLFWGLWRYSPYARYRIKRRPVHSPYAGFMKWHHYAGLVFGLATSTWIFSGLMSMTPWDWSPGNAPTPAQRETVTGGALPLDVVTLARLREAAAVLERTFAPRELQIAAFQGEPFAAAYRPPAASLPRPWLNTDYPAFVEPVLLEHQYVWLTAPHRGPFTAFDPTTLEGLAADAMPGAHIVEAEWLADYDAYYYDRNKVLNLPVLRARYDDREETWLYFDPAKGLVVQKEERRSRLERWLYHGLHSLDFPVLYARRPLWDLLLIVLSIGGTVLSVTAIAPAIRRLARHVRRVLPLLRQWFTPHTGHW